MAREVARVEHGVEPVWSALARHLGWASHFIVVYVFSPTAGQAAALGDRLANWADPAAFGRLVARAPGELGGLVAELDTQIAESSRAPSFARRHVLWVEGVVDDPRGWAQLLARLNERREAMVASLRALVVVARVRERGRLAALGPDLWSIRASSLELTVPPAARPESDAAVVAAADATAAPRLTTAPTEPGRSEASTPVEALAGLVKQLRHHARRVRHQPTRVEIDAGMSVAKHGYAAYVNSARDDPQLDRICEHFEREWLEFADVLRELGELDACEALLANSPRPTRGSGEDRLWDAHFLVLEAELDLDRGRSPRRVQDLLFRANAIVRAQLGGAASPLSARMAMAEGRISQARGRPEDASRAYARALELGAGAEARRRLGATYIEEGRLHRRPTAISRPHRTQAWHVALAAIRSGSSDLVATRAALAHCTDTSPPVVPLLRAACRLSYTPDADPSPLHAALDRFDGPAIWPALARHVARQSTDADRAYLISLARDPARVDDERLRWGLRYWIRGDLLFEDGSTLTLDEIWAAHGRGPLPYLEDMPPEPALPPDVPEPDDPT